MAVATKNVKLIQKFLSHVGTKASGQSHGSILLSGDPGIGKAQPLDSLIKTPDGWIKMGDIKVGDVVSTPDGNLAPVTGVFPQGQKQIYKLTFADGRTARACSEHLWKVRRRHRNKQEIISTEKIGTLLETTKLWLYVPLVEHDIVTQDIELPIDPYVLGCLLGDGSFVSSGLNFTSADGGIVEEISTRLDAGYLLNKQKTTKYGYRLIRDKANRSIGERPKKGAFYNTYIKHLEELGLLGKYSEEKFIPELYKNASVSQKKELIAGLIDTDGYVSKVGSVSISTSSQIMASDIQEIIWSIGGIAKITSKRATYVYKGERKEGLVSYQISIRYPDPKSLSKLERKRRRMPSEYQYEDLKLRIIGVEEDGVEEAQCILIDHPDHLYITDNYIVTHNTTFINALTRLLGMEVIVIEIPHISEEHVINIPFIVFNPASHTQKTGTTQMTPDYKLVLSQSNLYSLIKAAKKIPDGAYIQSIYSSPRDVINTYEFFGGTKEKIPDAFAQARASHNVILFLDEYFRKTSPRIRNILRSLLNNRIGMHVIPNDVYIVYASNMRDPTGLEEIPKNHQFTQIKMHNPEKDEWFDWLVAKFEHDEHVKLNMTVINHFRKILKTEDISHEDVNAEVRTSPRRWEQLMLYINSSLPAKDEDAVKGLLTNVKANFINYLTQKHSELARKVMDAVVKLIKTTSKLEASPSTVHESHEWRSALSHQIEVKMKLGEHRKYIPVVSGAPGIGKTSHVITAAADLGLLFIDIDCSELNAEDVIGLPLPWKEDEETKEMSTRFSKPKLFQQILDKIKNAEAEHLKKLKPPEQKEFQNRRWKYLILFDELNRTDEKTFNSLRRVLLEKNFGPSGDSSGSLLSLPKESIIVAAINPDDINTTEFTHHVRDVLDIIHSTSSWDATVKFMKGKKLPNILDESKKIGLGVIDTFANKFRTKSSSVPKEQQQFHLDLGSDVYFSPREYSDLYTTMVSRLNPIVKEVQETNFTKEPHRAQELEKSLREGIFEALEDSLNFSFEKHQTESDEFINTLKTWVLTSKDIDIGEDIFYKKTQTSELDTILGEYMEGKNVENIVSNIELINYMNNTNIQKFVEHLSSMLHNKLKDEKSVTKYLLNKKNPRKELKNKQIVNGSGKASLLENLVLSLIYAIKVHQFTNEQISGAWKGLSKGISTALNNIKSGGDINEETQDKIDEAGLELRGDIHTAIAGMT